MIINNITTLLVENKYSITYDVFGNVIDALDNLPISQQLDQTIGIGFKELSIIMSLAGLAYSIGQITYNYFTSIKYKVLKLKILKQKLKKDKNNKELQKEIEELEESLKQEKAKLQVTIKNKI